MEGTTFSQEGEARPGAWPNLAAYFDALVAVRGDAVAFRYAQANGWRDLTWPEFAAGVRECAAGGQAFGLRAGDTVCVLARTRPEWLQVDLGAVTSGLCCAGIYPTEPASKAAYVLNDCGARVAFVDDAEQVSKLQAARAECPRLEAVVVFDEAAVPPEDPWFISLAAWRRAGRESLREGAPAGVASMASIGPETPAILIYTSGTTGPPKGAIVTHGNLLYQLEHAPGLLGLQPGWTRPCFLPLCHVAERMFTYLAMASGMVSCFVDGPNELLASLPRMRPHFMLAVPRVYEKLRALAQAWLAAQPEEDQSEIRAAETRALTAQARAVQRPLTGEEAQALLRDQDGPLRRLRASVGLDQAAMLMSGGARFPVELGEWLDAVGAPVFDIYGMTECGTIALNKEPRTTPGLVGHPFPHGEVTLGPDGEILVRGPHVFGGYLNLPDKTAEAFREGWFRTGDVGRFDAQGRLILLDRIKDIIISSSGKNITPSEVEGALKKSPVIADAVAVGDGRNYVTALIVIDPAVAEQALEASGKTADSFAELVAAASTQALVAEAVTRANLQLSRAEGIKSFRIIPQQLTATDEAMTPTLKLKRRVIIDMYADLVAEMYPATSPAVATA